MYSEIIQRVKTKEEKEQLTEELEALRGSLFEQKAVFDDMLKTRVRARVSELIKEELSRGEIDKERYLQGLIEKLKSLKTLKLFLAFEPTQAVIDKFCTFIGYSGRKDMVLDLSYEPRILGGAIIIFEGEYRNFSLRRVFEEEFNTMESSILKILSGYKI